MAGSNTPIRVDVPDLGVREFPGSMTVEEIRASLVALGYTNLQSATIEHRPDGSLKFNRPAGGTKGVRS